MPVFLLTILVSYLVLFARKVLILDYGCSDGQNALWQSEEVRRKNEKLSFKSY